MFLFFAKVQNGFVRNNTFICFYYLCRKNNNMLRQIVQERIHLAGISQAKVAEEIQSTPTQLSLYLRGEASLNNESLERCIEILDININTYHKRYEIAKKIATQFSEKNISVEAIMSMDKKMMIHLTGIEAIDTLLDVSTSELEKMIKYGLVDYESTYPFFRIMVAHIMQLGDKVTSKKAMNSWITLSNTTNAIGKGTLLGIAGGVFVLGALMQAAITLLGKSGGLLSPLLSLTVHSLTIKKK